MIQPTKKRFLLAAPLVVLPFLCAIFFALGGGKGKTAGRMGLRSGLNLELPEAFPAARKSLLDKLGAYRRADADSMRKKQFAGEDPYRVLLKSSIKPDSVKRPVFGLTPPAGAAAPSEGDAKAEALLTQLNRLRTSLQPPQPRPEGPRRVQGREPDLMAQSSGLEPPPTVLPLPRMHRVDTATDDPQLDRLNRMLDKVIRIQHPEEDKPAARAEARFTEQLIPLDSTANAIAAVVPDNETLVNGASLPLRLTDSVRLHGIVIAAGTWVYGTVGFHNDRMTVQIRSLRLGNHIYPADLQVYDLDGMPGIHVPVRLSQEAVKESTDESVMGINVLTADASWQGQAANAGVQAGKNLFGRRVRQVRVSVRAGYVVLLRNASAGTSAPGTGGRGRQEGLSQDERLREVSSPEPPSAPELLGGRVLEKGRTEGLELALRGVYLQDGLLWMALEWRNRSSINYSPRYYRWIIRDRHHFRRMAQQDLPLDPVSAGALKPVAGDSTAAQWVAFRAFAIAKDKELVLQVGEKDGGRALELVIPSKILLDAKTLPHEKSEEGPR